MKNHLPPKTLHMLIKNKWLVESITSLGSGYLSHLTYPYEAIHPELLREIQAGFSELVLGEIIFQDAKENLRIAEIEIVEVNNFNSFIRFIFRILTVNPFNRSKLNICKSAYSCYYSTNPA